MIATEDIIAAPATAPGRGAVAVVRASGPGLDSLHLPLTGRPLRPRHAHYVTFYDAEGNGIDSGLALYFPGPNSYTGEDILELHCHGNPVVVEMLLRRLFELGARPAQPGEYSRRAFLNGKLDLAQAEAVAALIESRSEQAVRAAQRSLQGQFSHQVKALVEGLIRLRAQIEATLDFGDEDIDFLSDAVLQQRLQALLEQLQTLQHQAGHGRLLREGMTVVIAGPPNAGKSSLLNCLAQREAAIVTDIAGTTRDLLHEHILIDGIPLHVIDTAGLRPGGDAIEQEGMRRAQHAMGQCDRILWVQDGTRSSLPVTLPTSLPTAVEVTLVYNKVDLTGEPPGLQATESTPIIRLSAKTGAGIDLLRDHLKSCMGGEGEVEDTLAARRRHLDALDRAQDAMVAARRELAHNQAPELVAENLRLAQQALAEITGEFTSDDLLGRIFSEFCIGK